MTDTRFPVTRYDMERIDYEWYKMEECPEGDYVTYEDYTALEDDYFVLRKDYQRLLDKIKDIWQEG